MDLDENSNVGIEGVYCYRVDQNTIMGPPQREYSQTSVIQTSIVPNLRLSGWGFHLDFHFIRTARVKIQISGCSILLFLVLLPGAMASIKHKRVVRTI